MAAVESERASKTEVSRQLVYMLGGQSEPDTDQFRAAEDRLRWRQMAANVVHDGMAP